MMTREKRDLEVRGKQMVERATGEPTREGHWYIPEVDINEGDQNITVYSDLPGVRPEDVDVDVREGILTLTANVEPMPTNMRLIHQEYEVGGYQRRFNLGERVDQAKIEARFDNGVLKLTLPKVEAHKPRKIKIS